MKTAGTTGNSGMVTRMLLAGLIDNVGRQTTLAGHKTRRLLMTLVDVLDNVIALPTFSLLLPNNAMTMVRASVHKQVASATPVKARSWVQTKESARFALLVVVVKLSTTVPPSREKMADLKAGAFVTIVRGSITLNTLLLGKSIVYS